ncbi:MAG: O-antigen ligase family protein [Clostridia bacterium]
MLFAAALCVLFAGAYLAVKNPIVFTIYWGLFGSSYDACGIMSLLNSGFGYYRLCMNAILLMCCIGSSIYFFRRPPKKATAKYMVAAWMFMFGIFVSQSIVFISEDISFMNLSYGFVDYGPSVFIIWLANYEKISEKMNIRRYLIGFIIIQVMLACLIIFTKKSGIHFLDSICGSNYISDGNIYNRNILDSIVGLPYMFVNKYLYNGLGQFHNGNDMGFYGAAGILAGIFLAKEGQKLWHKTVGIILIYFSLLIWGNSGMRGPVVGIICGVILSFALYKKPSKWIVGVLATLGVVAFLFSETGLELINYLLPDSSDISYTERETLRENGLRYIQDNWLLGAGGLLGNLTAQEIDPHELPLRISCLFGVGTGFISAVLIYAMPIIDFVKKKKTDLFTIIGYAIVFFVSITDNYTCIALFYFLFAEAVCTMCYRTQTDIYRYTRGE